MTRTKSEQLIFDEKLKPFYNIVGKEYLCRKCNQHIGSKREEHYKICNGKGTLETILNTKKKYSDLCDLGCGQKSQYYHKNGKAYCSPFGNKCPVKVKKDSEAKKDIPHPRGGLGKPSWNKGLTQENNESIKQQQETFKKNYAIYGNQRKNKNHTEETKEYLKLKMYERYANGWQATSCGRAKSYPYTSPSAGSVHLTGSWEVAFAEALDQAGIAWEKNKTRFPYIKPNGDKASYLPDFYISQIKTFIETKGYETDLDRAKWAQFTEKLIVVHKKEIFQIKKWLENKTEITEYMLFKLCNI